MQWTKAIGVLALVAGTLAQGPARTIEIHAKRFSFTPSEITIKRGETVDLKIVSEDVTHGFVIKELNINREISKNHPVDVVVTPQTAGDFHGQCGRFCGSGHGKMTFTIHVTD